MFENCKKKCCLFTSESKWQSRRLSNNLDDTLGNQNFFRNGVRVLNVRRKITIPHATMVKRVLDSTAK